MTSVISVITENFTLPYLRQTFKLKLIPSLSIRVGIIITKIIKPS